MNRRALLISGGAAAVLFVLWFLLLWGPQGGEMSDAEARRDAAVAESQALEARLARLRDAQERAPDLQADLDTLRRAVPDDPQLAQFILDANDVAIETGVDFLSISPGVPSPGTPPVITLSINVNGGYFEVIDYLDRLEELPRIVVVDGVNLTPNQTPGGLLELRVALTARMFATSAPNITTTTTTPPADGATTTTTAGASGG